ELGPELLRERPLGVGLRTGVAVADGPLEHPVHGGAVGGSVAGILLGLGLARRARAAGDGTGVDRWPGRTARWRASSKGVPVWRTRWSGRSMKRDGRMRTGST